MGWWREEYCQIGGGFSGLSQMSGLVVHHFSASGLGVAYGECLAMA